MKATQILPSSMHTQFLCFWSDADLTKMKDFSDAADTFPALYVCHPSDAFALAAAKKSLLSSSELTPIQEY